MDRKVSGAMDGKVSGAMGRKVAGAGVPLTRNSQSKV
jgi:hypothetical protein